MYRLFASLIALIMLAGCASTPTDIISSGDRYAAAPPASDAYRLGVGDKVRMTVFNEPTLSGEFAVSASGTLSLPLIGEIPALDNTPAAIADAAQKKFAEGYLRDPKVGIEVISYRPFFILGEVKSPGQYPFVNGLTVLNAVATAQGFTPRAQKGSVYIRRAGANDEQAYVMSPDLRILPGDTIRFGERYF